MSEKEKIEKMTAAELGSLIMDGTFSSDNLEALGAALWRSGELLTQLASVPEIVMQRTSGENGEALEAVSLIYKGQKLLFVPAVSVLTQVTGDKL